ncbi:hypothetical protein EVAR_51218_1 [Eumeta japonica]|uniref:Uncharacterized protein n=1 Tax=Eumeta variegata TaxID=151549 RepID=A0A4C1ZDS0_EUMVA|nr:hypothetical protein EVAR_51218_1 [Eumeta japonica]
MLHMERLARSAVSVTNGKKQLGQKWRIASHRRPGLLKPHLNGRGWKTLTTYSCGLFSPNCSEEYSLHLSCSLRLRGAKSR